MFFFVNCINNVCGPVITSVCVGDGSERPYPRVVMPSEMTVRQSHDICLGLQDTIEAMHEVERAFVHVDYVARRYPEHKTERQLLRKSRSFNDMEEEDVIQRMRRRRRRKNNVLNGQKKTQSNASNDEDKDDGAFGSAFLQIGSGSGGSDNTASRFLGDEGGIEDPLLPTAAV